MRWITLLITFVILLGGCTSGSSGGGKSSGLEITQFNIHPSTIYEDESVDVNVVIENAGSKTLLADSKLWIYGPSPYEWLGTGEIGEAFSLSGLTIPSEDMMPGDYDEIYGSFEYIGDVPQGVYKEYTFIARLCYPYITTYVGNFYVISRDEARLERKSGATYDTLSSGPIGISFVKTNRIITGKVVSGRAVEVDTDVAVSGAIDTEKMDIRIVGSYESGGESVRFMSLPIEVVNRADGFPTLPSNCALGPDVDIKDRGYVAVRVLLDGRDITQACFKDEEIREVNVVYSDGSVGVGLFGIVKLRREKGAYTKGRITCRLEDIDFNTPERQYTLEIEVYYDYYIDRRGSVKVMSTEDIY